MTVKPILFNSENVLAILAGHKLQTRRILKGYIFMTRLKNGQSMYNYKDKPYESLADIAKKCPYLPGDKLWVRETYRCMGFDMDKQAAQIQYKDGTSDWKKFEFKDRFKKYAVCWAG
jgi:hypothetical protein